MRTEAEGYAAIEIAVRIAPTAKQTAIVRLFAIAQVFYRQPVGDAAADEIQKLTDKGTVEAIFFISGYSIGGGGSNWEKLAFQD
jgi:hypothetical protein